MMMHESLTFRCGLSIPNRFILAPMTNQQSHANGNLSEEEMHWLTMRAKGGFGMVMTCASHVSISGQGFPNQMGIFNGVDGHLHTTLNEQIHGYGAASVVQIYHGGLRSPSNLIGHAPLAPSPDEKTGARELTITEVHQVREDFILAAVRAQEFGYDGVQIHGAHGYLLAQFLSPTLNRRTDDYGGSLINRGRLIVEILEGIRERCGTEFFVSVRLSPERFGMRTREILDFARWLLALRKVDLLDWSLWDVHKEHDGVSLLEQVCKQDRHGAWITVAGMINSSLMVHNLIPQYSDCVSIGRAAIIHHDFPTRCLDVDFVSNVPPVTKEYLLREGLSEPFVDYMRRWPNFVSTDQ